MRRGVRALLLPLGAALLLACCDSGDDRGGAREANLALGRAASGVGASGSPSVVTDGLLAPEGAPAGHAGIELADPRSSVSVDLGATRTIGALLLQASGFRVFFVEGTTDGRTWEVLWRVGPVPGSAAARTRTVVLARPAEARQLRVRPTSPGPAEVSELQAFEAKPAWPALDNSHPDAALPLWPGLTRERLTILYQALASLLMMAAGWIWLARARTGPPGEKRLLGRVLVGLALVSLFSWPNLLNFHYHGFVHKWEVFHYYMGGKYLPELGYGSLYTCTVVVDEEDGLDPRGRVIRDLRDNRLVPAESLLQRSDECHDRFSKSRWEAFRRDTSFFREAMGERAWGAVRRDHGFNGTPAWAVLGGALARLAPASWTPIVLLTLVDVGLVLALFIVAARVFGRVAACLAAGFWGVNALSVWGWTGGGFLRYDWVFWLVVGIASLKVGRPALAGFALAYSALLRIFPVLALAGLALKAAWEIASERSLAPLRRYARFAAGAAAAGVFFLLASSLMAGGPRVWGEFAHNSRKHLATDSANLVGLQVVLAYDDDARLEVMTDPLALDPHGAWKDHLAAATRQSRPSRWVVVVAFGLLLALAVRSAPDWVAAVLGLGLMPVVLKLSSYYYCGFLVFALLWPASAGTGFALASFAWLTNVIVGMWPAVDAQYVGLSLAALAFAGGVIGAFAWGNRRKATSRQGAPVGYNPGP